MQRIIIIPAHNGVTVIDTRPEAEICYNNMKYAEERYYKRQQRRQRKPLYMLLCLLGFFNDFGRRCI